MAETRCPHGFLQSVVPCAVCSGLAKSARREPGKLPTGEQYNFRDLAGQTVAGVPVLSRAPNVNGNTRWRCQCACGELFIREGIQLRDQQKHGRTAKCDACRGGKTLRQARIDRAQQYAVAARAAAEPPKLLPTPDERFGGQDQDRGIVHRWWRVELDDEGRMVKAEPVEAIGANGLGVIYVLAYDIKGARKAAFNAYCGLRNKIRRARYRSENRCDCGRARDIEGGKKCSECLRQERRAKERAKARAKGEEVEPLDRAETYRKRRESERQEHRLEVLNEVRAAATTKAPREFYAWLDEQLGVPAEARRTA